MIATFVIAILAQPDMSPIKLPYQAVPAFMTYTRCYGERMRSDPRRRGPNVEDVRRAHQGAVEACHEVRGQQLALGLAAVGDEGRPLDTRTYRNRADAQAAVRRAFDRFDSQIEKPPLEYNDVED